MTTQDDIERQQQLLAAHRATLHHWLRQAAQHGGVDLAPPVTGNGIAETRAQIASIKVTLRGWGAAVEDLPGDQPSPIERVSARPGRQRFWWWPLGRRGNDIFDPEIDRRNRQVFINDMRRRFEERLASAPKIIRLRLAERQSAVEPPGLLLRPYDIARRQPSRPDEPLPARARLVDLYDEHNAQLLILGAPGAGKTFLLYELAHELVERAATDEAAPVPVLFSLAAWQPGQSLETWMITDLSRRYGAKPALIARLVKFGVILPLLDGLDEVDTLERRAQCAEVINAYRQSRDLLPPLVVASREREYQDLPTLKLNTALVVQPLASAQIARYLAGAAFAGLRQAMAHDAGLADLARTPLLLGLMAETYRDRAPQIPPGADEATLRQVVLGDYVAHCCAPRADAQAQRVPVARLRAFLSWLARGMIVHDNQQDFYIEFLQPSWLPTRSWRVLWYGVSIILCGMVGIVGFTVVGILGLGVSSKIDGKLGAGLVVGLLGVLGFGSLGGLGAGLVGGLGAITPVETLIWSWPHVFQRLRTTLIFGLGGGLVGGIVIELVVRQSAWLVVGIGVGLVVGIGVGLVAGLRTGLVDSRSIPNQGIMRSFRSAWLGGLVYGLVGGLAGALAGLLGFGLVFGSVVLPGVGIGVGLGIGTVVGLFGFLLCGGAAIIKHILLHMLLSLCTPGKFLFLICLEEARQRGLLIRVGGGYRFYHELLQRHFAAHEEPGYPRVPILAESQQPKKDEESNQAAD